MKSKHLIVPTQYYDPETFQVNHLVSLFLENGWRVTVIAPFPSYPNKYEFDGDTGALYEHPRLRICRFPVVLRDGLFLTTILNSLCFLFFGTILSVYFALRYPQSHIFAVQYSPFTCIMPAWAASLLSNASASLWIFDLWPQSISAFFGRIPFRKYVFRSIESIVCFVYSGFSQIFVSSPSFLSKSPIKFFKGTETLHSWEPVSRSPRLCGASIDTSQSLRLISIGNLGSAHNIDLLENLLISECHANINWSFVGCGCWLARM